MPRRMTEPHRAVGQELTCENLLTLPNDYNLRQQHLLCRLVRLQSIKVHTPRLKLIPNWPFVTSRTRLSPITSTRSGFAHQSPGTLQPSRCRASPQQTDTARPLAAWQRTQPAYQPLMTPRLPRSRRCRYSALEPIAESADHRSDAGNHCVIRQHPSFDERRLKLMGRSR